MNVYEVDRGGRVAWQVMCPACGEVYGSWVESRARVWAVEHAGHRARQERATPFAARWRVPPPVCDANT